MRALLDGQRNGSVGVVLGLLGVLALLVVSLGSTLYVYSSLHSFRQAAYERCLQRLDYDAASNRLRIVEAQEWRRLADLSAQANLTPQDKAARASSYRRLAEAADAAVASQVRGNCDQYRP